MPEPVLQPVRATVHADPVRDPDPDLRVLLLPGWQDSGATHWQSRWEVTYGDERVVQADWDWPLRGDWMARLDEVMAEDQRPVVLVAHSLGCLLVAAWAAHSRQAGRVRGALLVAPPDVERAEAPLPLHKWRPPVRARLPFPTLAVISSDDPFCEPARAAALTDDWGADRLDAGPRGHINGESGLGDWPEGRAALARLLHGPHGDAN